MRRCKTLTAIVTCVVMSLAICSAQTTATTASTQTVPTCKLADDRVEAFIASKARELEGSEYCQFRRYQTFFDLDGDRKDDFIVLFYVEVGGSGKLDFLAVWPSSRASQLPLLVEVSAEQRTGLDVTVDPDRRIHVKTLEWRSGDAHCCPSGKGELVYEVKGDKIELAARKSQKGRKK